MRAWVVYAGVSLAAAAGLAASASLFLSDAAARGVWLAAGVAWLLQLAAFALLLLARRSGTQLFIAGWAAGMLLRFGGLAAVAFVVSRRGTPPLDATLVGLVGIVFVLLLIEPLFLRLDTRTS